MTTANSQPLFPVQSISAFGQNHSSLAETESLTLLTKSKGRSHHRLNQKKVINMTLNQMLTTSKITTASRQPPGACQHRLLPSGAAKYSPRSPLTKDMDYPTPPFAQQLIQDRLLGLITWKTSFFSFSST
jgi:hypothetical protein